MVTGISFLAVFLSAIASMVIGSLWYGPLFGKKFKEEMGMNEWPVEKQVDMKKSMTKSYIFQFIASLVMFFILDWYINTGIKPGLAGALGNAFAIWIGFVIPLKLGEVLWGGKTSLFWLGIGNMFFTLLAAALIMNVFR